MKDSITEIDGKFYKKAKVVMLATSEDSNITMLLQGGNLLYQLNNSFFCKSSSDIHNQHLYFLSDEEIKDGIDWMLHKLDSKPIKCGEAKSCGEEAMRYGYKKIIATTNPELKVNGKPSGFGSPPEQFEQISLPRPSNDFIKKFVEEYNKGSVISEVLVEIEDKGRWGEPTHPTQDNSKWESNWKLKVAPDNTIAIKPVVDDWDEVFNAFDNYDGSTLGQVSWRNWLRENYHSPKKK